MLLPREHGAWGLLLQPFVFSAILARRGEWLLVAALGLALTGFVMREPLIVLARQRWVWRQRRPESGAAWRHLAWEAPLAAAMWGALAWKVPLAPLAALTAVALGLTGLAAGMTAGNRQRSITLQVVSSVGLCSTALLAALAAEGSLRAWAWQLWVLLSAHAVSAILVVRARLEARAGAGTQFRKKALWFQWLVVAAGLTLALGRFWLAAACVLFSGLTGGWELRRLGKPAVLAEPLKRVGWRTLGVSVAQGALAVAALW